MLALQYAVHRWWADFLMAALYSLTAIAALTAAMCCCRWHEGQFFQFTTECSISDCAFAADGGSALVIYWHPALGRDCIRRRLAGLDLLRPDAGFEPVQFDAHASRLTQLSGNRCYVADNQNRLAAMDIAVAKSTLPGFTLPGQPPEQLVASPDGELVMSLLDETVQLFDVRTNAVRWQRDCNAERLAFHPRCGLIAALSGQIAQLSLETGEVLRVIAREPAGVRALAIDPQGRSVAWLNGQEGIELRRLSDEQSLWRHAAHGSLILPPAYRAKALANVLEFSADGSLLVTAAMEDQWVLGVWDAASGARVRTLRGHDATINGAAFLRDGTLASWSADGTLRLWDVRRSALKRKISARQLAMAKHHTPSTKDQTSNNFPIQPRPRRGFLSPAVSAMAG